MPKIEIELSETEMRKLKGSDATKGPIKIAILQRSMDECMTQPPHPLAAQTEQAGAAVQQQIRELKEAVKALRGVLRTIDEDEDWSKFFGRVHDVLAATAHLVEDGE